MHFHDILYSLGVRFGGRNKADKKYHFRMCSRDDTFKIFSIVHDAISLEK